MLAALVLYAVTHHGPGPVPSAPTAAARVEALRGRVWHDDAPLADGSYRMTCVMEYLGSSGEVTKTLVLEHERTFRGGRVREILVSAREDGRDVTERERRKQDAAAADRQTSPSRWSLDEALAPPLPFLSSPVGTYRFTSGAGSIGNTLDYTPSGGASVRATSGSVVLDPSDGLPLQHRFVPRPLPRMIRSLVTVVHYQRIGTIAVPVSTESVGEGGLLFIKRRFRVAMTYRDWQVGPAAPRPPQP
jgi:hypothetical protein